ncbi:hypothetical protein M413DRAFT_414003 [Hebeloma cylindrosporum]|uniref:GST N-terminal domain-containing protein n=1 Tax=Hebeloma cylindrosporum TaxID=76867 RepID=A0A0C2XRN3_HEBCY|nr:hypothetical protein M413DRAFT_414003 [Hebeloma cylindrosporum h7]
MAIPDAQIFPHATSEAAKTVERHQEPQDLVFYAGWFCPFVQRAWISLEEKRIPYQYKEVNPYKKEPHFLAMNPKGLVPAVEYQGKALYESLILCEFFEDAYPSHKPNLLPSEPADRALTRMWLDHISKTFIPAFHRLLQAQDVEKQNEALQDLAENIKGPFFNGEFGLVDVAIAPWIVRDFILQEHRGFKRGDVSPVWEAYAERIEKRDSVVNTSSLREHLAVIFGRYLRDEAQSEVAKATRAGKVIP